MSRNVGFGVFCNLAKFHAFIIKVNNSLYFWSITAGLNDTATDLWSCQLYNDHKTSIFFQILWMAM